MSAENAAPIVMVRGIEVDGLLHDLQDVVIPGGPMILRCGLRFTLPTGRIWPWTPEQKAPPQCLDCRDLPAFWP